MNLVYIILIIFYCTFSVFAGIKIQPINPPISTPSKAQLDGLTQLRGQRKGINISWNEFNATPTFLNGMLTDANYITKYSSPVNAALQFIDENKILFKIKSPLDEFTLFANQTDQIGMTHVKFNQVYQGLAIKGSQLIVHFAKDGSISCVNGRYISTPDISLIPSITQDAAAQIASGACSNQKPTGSELIIYMKDDKPTLAYKINVPTVVAPMQFAIINALSGEVLEVDSGIRYDGPEIGAGIGLNGAIRIINDYQATNKWSISGTQYFMVDASNPMYVAPVDSLNGVIATYDAKNDTIDSNPYTQAAIVYDQNADNSFTDDQTRAAVDAHYFTGHVYDYFQSHFGRNSWDDKGTSLFSVVHYLSRYNNAFWNGYFMTYGDGDGIRFSNLAGSLDVIAHELTHGVTQATANLEYRGQSGALNESYSDVFACMVDSADWLIGEDIYTPAIIGDALRNMADPHNGGMSSADQGWQPAYMNEYLYLPYTADRDNGGVHINSGIPNQACYLVATQIGSVKTEQIYYRTLIYYLTQKSLFIDARNATLQSAIDLYGSGSVEYNSVTTAFDIVGITSDLPRTDELAYEWGSPSTGGYESDANWGIANQFTATGNGKLAAISFYYYGENNPSGDGSFRIQILDSTDVLYVSPVIRPTDLQAPSVQYKGWLSVSLLSSNITVVGNFWVGIFYDGINRPMIGIDTVSNGHAWEWDATQSKWIFLDQNSYFPATLYMRAIVNTTTSTVVEEINTSTPSQFSLSQNYPNPFNPSTTINYTIPTTQHVRLSIYNILGEQVALLVDEDKHPGTYTAIWDGKNMPSGIYYFRLYAGQFTDIKKMIFIK